ncbi:MAG: ZIP family metal transporter [Bacteroidetes bacterium]|nr:ZIP family metal transporter [Bacteroidota bacterium]MDA0859543.1 ZIP family metal transporter [Bacteroidota bacterium]MDA1317871.1 ZIP family metal transporter [Bacteroidota bacterium]
MFDFLLPILSVVIGLFVAVWFFESKTFKLKLLLTFSGAFLLSTTIFELLPDVYENLNAKYTGVFILSGIVLQIILEFFSKGAEHGHLHHHKDTEHRFPWLLFFSLGIHSFLEGFPISAHETIVYGVFIHKIPVAILIASYLLSSKISKLKAFLFLIAFALLTPFGTLVSEMIVLSNKLFYSINALVVGMFFHIATIILFEADEGHQFNINKIAAIVLAVLIAFGM